MKPKRQSVANICREAKADFLNEQATTTIYNHRKYYMLRSTVTSICHIVESVFHGAYVRIKKILSAGPCLCAATLKCVKHVCETIMCLGVDKNVQIKVPCQHTLSIIKLFFKAGEMRCRKTPTTIVHERHRIVKCAPAQTSTV